MTKNGFDLQTISIKRATIQADRVLPFVLVTEKKEKADPSAKPKEPLFSLRTKNNNDIHRQENNRN